MTKDNIDEKIFFKEIYCTDTTSKVDSIALEFTIGRSDVIYRRHMPRDRYFSRKIFSLLKAAKERYNLSFICEEISDNDFVELVGNEFCGEFSLFTNYEYNIFINSLRSDYRYRGKDFQGVLKCW